MTSWWSCPRSGHRLLWTTDPEGVSVVRCPSRRCGYATVVPTYSTRPTDDTDTPVAAPKRRGVPAD